MQRLFRYGLGLVILGAMSLAVGWGFRSMVHTQHPSYVANQQCLACHRPQAQQWSQSHHALGMAEANATSVVGDFNHSQFSHAGITSTFFKRDGKFYVNTEGADGKFADFPIKYTIGIDPLQQYLIELPGGRLQNFTVAWDVKKQRWFHLYPKEKTPPGDVLHWTGHYQVANMMCIACHTTNLQKNYDQAADSYQTHWSEINVSCQSCHGPGSQHIKWAQGKFSDAHQGLSVDFKHAQAKTIVETCATCHSRRNELTAQATPGQDLLDNYLPVLLTSGLYQPDGQQQAEVYAYGSFAQSKMYQQGVSCIDCHNPHTGKLKLSGNAVCTQCHQIPPNPRFVSAAGKYDSPAHHFHKMNSSGAACVSCHMPASNYMIVHSRPDHSIRVPRPDLSIKYGVSNACNTCHSDKTAQWSVDKMNQWYGKTWQQRSVYGEHLSQARDNASPAQLIALLNNKNQPDIINASLLYLLGNAGGEGAATLVENTRNPNALQRYAAVGGLEKLPAEPRLATLAPLLNDPIRAVRIETARVLSSVAPQLFTAGQRQDFARSLAEFKMAQMLNLDMPGANLNLAVLSENQGDSKLAEVYYRKALQLDPDFTPARLNLASLENKLQRNEVAEQVLQEGVQRLPDQGDLQYALGLLLAEEHRLDEASLALAEAARLLPERVRVRYNYALALQQLGQLDKAEQNLLVAYHLAPRDTDVLYALASLYAQQKKMGLAEEFARKLRSNHSLGLSRSSY